MCQTLDSPAQLACSGREARCGCYLGTRNVYGTWHQFFCISMLLIHRPFSLILLHFKFITNYSSQYTSPTTLISLHHSSHTSSLSIPPTLFTTITTPNTQLTALTLLYSFVLCVALYQILHKQYTHCSIVSFICIQRHSYYYTSIICLYHLSYIYICDISIDARIIRYDKQRKTYTVQHPVPI